LGLLSKFQIEHPTFADRKPLSTEWPLPSLRQLEYFVALSRTRHFRRAADRAGVSQPTLSAQLSELERRLGVQLVERSRSGIVITAIGTQVLRLAEEIVERAKAIEDLTRSHQGGLSGLVRLGLPHTIGPYLLPHLIGPLHRSYPGLRLYVREDFPQALPDGLESGDHDLVILPVPVRKGDFETVPLFRERLHLVAAADHRLAQAGTADKNDLKGEPILALAQGHQLRTQVAQLCEEFGAELMTSYEGTSLDTLRQMVGMGLGLTFLPELYTRRELVQDGDVRIVPLTGRPLNRTIGLVWRTASALSPAFKGLAEEVRATLRAELKDLTVL
jgi:LysR family transcriptional regulator, hydrogen peroxide-inducible genes activator